MASLFKKAFNAARIAVGKAPLIVETSTGIDTFTVSSPLVEIFTKRSSAREEQKEFKVIAETMEGVKKPENQLWKVTLVVGDYHMEPLASGITYETMLKALKSKELEIARTAGFKGTDEEITAKRKPVVGRNNILNFTK